MNPDPVVRRATLADLPVCVRLFQLPEDGVTRDVEAMDDPAAPAYVEAFQALSDDNALFVAEVARDRGCLPAHVHPPRRASWWPRGAGRGRRGRSRAPRWRDRRFDDALRHRARPSPWSVSDRAHVERATHPGPSLLRAPRVRRLARGHEARAPMTRVRGRTSRFFVCAARQRARARLAARKGLFFRP